MWKKVALAALATLFLFYLYYVTLAQPRPVEFTKLEWQPPAGNPGVVFPANADLNSDQLTDVNELLDYRDIVYNNLAVQETRLMLFQEFCALLSKPQEYSRLPVDPRRLVWVVKMHALQYPLPQLGTIEDVTILALYDAETGLHWGRTYKGKQEIDLPNPMEKVITPILKRNRPIDSGVYITVSDFPPLTEQRPANSHLSPVQLTDIDALLDFRELAARNITITKTELMTFQEYCTLARWYKKPLNLHPDRMVWVVTMHAPECRPPSEPRVMRDVTLVSLYAAETGDYLGSTYSSFK